MRIKFFGAAGEVTGSCHIIECNGHRVLVDCGLIQGGKEERRRNRAPFPFAASEIDAVILTHAHIDHSGRLPLLVRRGFTGKIHTHRASAELTRILLRDSAMLQEYEAARLNKKREARGKARVKPLYESVDAEAVNEHLQTHPYRQWFELAPGIRCRLWDAGHILGSGSAEVELSEGDKIRRIIFSGDLGQYDTPILRDPEVSTEVEADLVIMESTYGNRRHREREDTMDELAGIIKTAVEEGGNILIPAFAVGRSQEILYHLTENARDWGVTQYQIFLDSPLAIEASRIYWSYPQLYDEDATSLRNNKQDIRLLENLHMTRTVDESRAINEVKRHAIIIAGSGMCNGGRILHHMKHRLSRRDTHMLFIGYQAHGTLGRRIIDGAKEVRIHGQEIKVGAQIHTLGGFSAHGDQQDMTRWYQNFANHPPIYLVHGEPESARAFRDHLTATTGARVSVAETGQVVELL